MGAPLIHTLRVRYGESDLQGIAFNAHYLDYFDIGMTELWRAAYGNYQTMLDRGVDIVLAEARLRFRQPGAGSTMSWTCRWRGHAHGHDEHRHPPLRALRQGRCGRRRPARHVLVDLQSSAEDADHPRLGARRPRTLARAGRGARIAERAVTA